MSLLVYFTGLIPGFLTINFLFNWHKLLFFSPRFIIIGFSLIVLSILYIHTLPRVVLH